MRRAALLAVAAATLVSACRSEPLVTAPSYEATMRWATDRIVRSLPAPRLAGQLIMVGIENDADGRPLLSLDAAHRELLERVQPGAAVLFGQTFSAVAQVRALVAELYAAVAVPPIVATDYEGGLVSRLTTTGGIPATPIPPADVVGRAVAGAPASADAPATATPGAAPPDGIALARRLGEVMGRELRALGVTMNFAPVADVDPPEGTGAIGRHGRTYGADPAFVGAVAAAVAEGLQREGVAAVIKHFPGHGAVAEDSHDELPVLAADAAAWRSHEALAFTGALAGRPVGLMTAHLAAPGVTGDPMPATLSARASLLARRDIGFAGLLVTDALNMRALEAIAPEPELVVRAIEAGNDFVLKPLDPAAAHAAILAALASGRLSRGRLESSVRRIFRAKRELGILGGPHGLARPRTASLPADPGAILGSAGHRAVVDRIAELAGGSN
ncbi:MAG: glycoside hydrolase family 3 N-terminal domain-containing protein [Spirochaetota bacterium]